jgi:RNA polymerase sigma-70 factor, ECF subfamily
MMDFGGGPLLSEWDADMFVVDKSGNTDAVRSFALYAPCQRRYTPPRGDDLFLGLQNRRHLDPPMRVILEPTPSAEPSAKVRAPLPGPAEVPTVQHIFAEHASFVWRTLRRLGVREADVDDLCQDVFVVVHKKLAEFEARSSIRTWLYGICVRTASDYRRSARVRNEEVTSAVPEQSIPAEQHQAVERRRALERLDAVLDQLDDDKRAVFVLYEIERLSMSEVAEAVRCPLQTAYSRLHAARKHVELAFRGGAP